MQMSEQIVQGIIGLLNELDPYGLEPGRPDGAPHDEYQSEAHPMANLLLNNGIISTHEVNTIWQDWFDEPLSEVIGVQRTEIFTTRLNLLIK